MNRSVSLRVLQRFFGLDLLFGVFVPIAHVRLLGLPWTSTTIAIEAISVLLRLALSTYFLFVVLAPADEWESTPPPARTDAVVLRAVGTLQSGAWRYSLWWTTTWAV